MQEKPGNQTVLVIWAVFAAVAYGVAVVAGAGLIPAWGGWHVSNDHHAAQARAFMAGSFGISESPAALSASRLWAHGAVHQVGGLGIPLSRVPFEWVAMSLGGSRFSAHLFFFVFLSLWGGGWIL